MSAEVDADTWLAGIVHLAALRAADYLTDAQAVDSLEQRLRQLESEATSASMKS